MKSSPAGDENNPAPPPPSSPEAIQSQNLNQETAPTKDKSNKNKLILGVLIFLIIIICIITGAFAGYAIYQRSQTPDDLSANTSSEDLQTTSNLSDNISHKKRNSTNIADWVTYEGNGFTFKHPSSWTQTTDSMSILSRSIELEEEPALGDMTLGWAELQIQTPISNKSAKDLLSESYYADYEWEKQNVKINNYNAIHISGYGGIGGSVYNSVYVIEKGPNTSIILNMSTQDQERQDEFENEYKQILSTFKFTDTETAMDTSNWKTYTNNDFGYSIKYPDTIEGFESEWEYFEFNDNFGNANSVGFRPREIREDVLWVINVYTNKDVEEVIADIGDQFDDRKEIRESITINGKNAILTTITTSINPNWIAKTVIIEKDGNIYSISNGAINNPEFGNFYKSFTFTN